MRLLREGVYGGTWSVSPRCKRKLLPRNFDGCKSVQVLSSCVCVVCIHNRFAVQPGIFTRATEIISPDLQTVSLANNVEIVLISHYNRKNSNNQKTLIKTGLNSIRAFRK